MTTSNATQTWDGSCLCGAVRYSIGGTPRSFLHCHCRRCRKATGTGHASNLIVTVESFQWTAGKELTRRYDVPEAERFHTVFCTRCGSLLPRRAADGTVAVIPAGTLDGEPGTLPQGRIFQDSRAAWSCQGDDLPAWERYPG